MNLEKYLVISGAPGVYKLVASRKDGLIIEDKQEGRNRFVPTRGQQVTPLATIAMYTYSAAEGENTLPLHDVFQRMLDTESETPVPTAKAATQELTSYFETVFPEYDRDRVHINDMKKCLKWFNFMKEKGLFKEIEAADAETKQEEAAPDATEAVSAPAQKENPSQDDVLQKTENDDSEE